MATTNATHKPLQGPLLRPGDKELLLNAGVSPAEMIAAAKKGIRIADELRAEEDAKLRERQREFSLIDAERPHLCLPTDDDFVRMAHILRESWRRAHDGVGGYVDDTVDITRLPGYLKKNSERDGHLIVPLKDIKGDKVLGMSWVGPPKQKGILSVVDGATTAVNEIHLAPEHTGQGLGRILLQGVFSEARMRAMLSFDDNVNISETGRPALIIPVACKDLPTKVLAPTGARQLEFKDPQTGELKQHINLNTFAGVAEPTRVFEWRVLTQAALSDSPNAKETERKLAAAKIEAAKLGLNQY